MGGKVDFRKQTAIVRAPQNPLLRESLEELAAVQDDKELRDLLRERAGETSLERVGAQAISGHQSTT